MENNFLMCLLYKHEETRAIAAPGLDSTWAAKGNQPGVLTSSKASYCARPTCVGSAGIWLWDEHQRAAFPTVEMTSSSSLGSPSESSHGSSCWESWREKAEMPWDGPDPWMYGGLGTHTEAQSGHLHWNCSEEKTQGRKDGSGFCSSSLGARLMTLLGTLEEREPI